MDIDIYRFYSKIFIESIKFNVCITLYWIYSFYIKRQKLVNHTHLFSLNKYKKNDKTILKYFQ